MRRVYTLIFSNPSPLRGVFDKNNHFLTCKDASVTLKDKLNLDTQNGGKTWHYYVQQLFGGRPDPNLLFSTMLGDSYSYFYGSSQSASQIIRQNVTINALRDGITSYAARSGDTASLMNLATTSSLEKQRLAHASIGQVAMRTLPMVQTILLGIAIGIFPLLVLAAVFNKLTLSVLKGYVFALMWLQSWPLLYAILNSAMTFYARQNGVPVVLSEMSQIQLKYSDLATTAGYISMMIPPLSWAMVKGLGAGFSSVYSHFASSSISPTASAAGSVVDGNYSYGNMQTENVNGFSWSTNSTTSFGQMTYQTGSGATTTQTRDGNMVMDSSGAMSRLPVGINATRQIAAAQQEMAREASTQAENALHGYSSSIASAWNTLSQYGSNIGHSSSKVSGADNTQSSQDATMINKMWNAVVSNAKANNISNDESYQNLMDKTRRGSASGEVYVGGKWDSGDQLAGKLGKWATGASINGGAKFSGSLSGSSGSTDSTSESGRETHDNQHNTSAQTARDFKESLDYFTSRKTSQSASHTDNNAESRVDQLSASLNNAKQSYDQYTTNLTRSHEYAEMASRTESMSGQMSEDLSQQFVNYVQKHAPNDAESILTNTSSPDVAERRRAMAWAFVQEQVQPGVDSAYSGANENIGMGIPTNSNGGTRGDVVNDYTTNLGVIDHHTRTSGIRSDISGEVDNMINQNQQRHDADKTQITNQSNDIKNQNSELEKQYNLEKNKHEKMYNEKMESQGHIPGGYSKEELTRMAEDMQKKHKGGKGDS